MIHLMLSAIIAFVFFAIFGELIVGLFKSIAYLILFLVFGIFAVVFLIWFAKEFNFEFLIALLTILFVVVLSAIFPNFHLKKSIQKLKVVFSKREVPEKFEIPKIHKSKIPNLDSQQERSVLGKPRIRYSDFTDMKLLEEFRAKYPFVMVDVDPTLRTQFIKECEWLQSKIGHFPSEKDQIEILNSMSNSK